MASLYLICLIIGGGLLLFSLFGSDADTHADSGLDVHTDGGALDAHVDHGVDHDHDLHHWGAEWGIAKEFLSVRTLFYFLAAFGATGFLLETFTPASTVMAAVWALVTGLLAALMAAAIYWGVRSTESGIVPEGHDHLVGLPAQVVIPVVNSRRGKVRVISGGREVELLARLYGPEDADCPRGATVVIVDIVGDTALITPAPSLPSETF